METIQVLPMIVREMKRSHFTAVEVARKLNVQPTTVHGMLSRPTLQVQRLVELSEALNYNFFLEVAAALPYPAPNIKIKVDEEAITAPFQERIKALELEVSILRQTLKDAVSR